MNASAPRVAFAGPHAASIAAASDWIHPATDASTQSGTAVELAPLLKPPAGCKRQF